MAWAADGRLLTIPPRPDWPSPRGAQAPTDEDEARWQARDEEQQRQLEQAREARKAAEPSPELVPF